MIEKMGNEEMERKGRQGKRTKGMIEKNNKGHESREMNSLIGKTGNGTEQIGRQRRDGRKNGTEKKAKKKV